MPRIHIVLSDEHLEKLDELADGRPRSLVLQRLIDDAASVRDEQGEVGRGDAR